MLFGVSDCWSSKRTGHMILLKQVLYICTNIQLWISILISSSISYNEYWDMDQIEMGIEYLGLNIDRRVEINAPCFILEHLQSLFLNSLSKFSFESHLNKNNPLYLFTLQHFLYILCIFWRASLVLHLCLAKTINRGWQYLKI